ncbi:MAG TPA: 6-phosphogluconolactonase, partial [Hanamia sp.]
ILLGLGTNGHTASLFPGKQVLHEHKPRIQAVYLENQKTYRITMTAPLINLAHNILFLVTGNEKAKIIKAIFSENNKYPAQLIKQITGELYWFIDKEAAGNLKK